jgi:hypothetical protein
MAFFHNNAYGVDIAFLKKKKRKKIFEAHFLIDKL